MKKTRLQVALLLLMATMNLSANAEEPESRNEYSTSIMLNPPPVYEDKNYQTDSGQQQQFCRDLQQRIEDLKKKPLQRSAAKDLYQKQCIDN